MIEATPRSCMSMLSSSSSARPATRPRATANVVANTMAVSPETMMMIIEITP
jgi:hypothetical protein